MWHPHCPLWATAADIKSRSGPPCLQVSKSSSSSHTSVSNSVAPASLLPISNDPLSSPSSVSSSASSTLLNNSNDQSLPGIPHIFHYIWLGSPIPKRLKILITSWQLLHPTWKHYIWEDKDIQQLVINHKQGIHHHHHHHHHTENTNTDTTTIPSVSTILPPTPDILYNADVFRSAYNYGQCSDILRYELLYNFGGIYIDMDMLALSSLDTLCLEADFFIGISNTKSSWELNNAIIGSIPGHPFLRQLIETIYTDYIEKSSSLSMVTSAPSTKLLTNQEKFMEVIQRTGPWFITEQLMPIFLELWKFSGSSELLSSSSTSSIQKYIDNTNPKLDLSSSLFRQLYPELSSIYSSSENNIISTTNAIQPTPLAPIHINRCFILPKHIFYPCPNTIQIPPPDWTKDSNEETLAKLFYGEVIDNANPQSVRSMWEKEMENWKQNNNMNVQEPFTLSETIKPWLIQITGSNDILQHIQYGTIGVHYWSRLWQRKEAQLTNEYVS